MHFIESFKDLNEYKETIILMSITLVLRDFKTNIQLKNMHF